MKTAVKIPDLAEHKPYRDAGKQRDRLAHEADSLRGQAQREGRGGRSIDPRLVVRVQGARAALAVAAGDVKITHQEACSQARTSMEEDEVFKALTSATVTALAARVEPALQYQRVVHDAGRKGIKLAGLPPFAEREVTELVAFTRDLKRRGLLGDDGVPAALRPLVDEAASL